MAKTITIGLRLEDGSDPAAVLTALRGIVGVSEPLDISGQIAVAAALANLETWDERCAREAVEEYGLETPDGIEEHIESAQTDLDYLTGQDEALNNLIHQSRAARGTIKDRTQIIAEALEVAGIDPVTHDDGPDHP